MVFSRGLGKRESRHPIGIFLEQSIKKFDVRNQFESPLWSKASKNLTLEINLNRHFVFYVLVTLLHNIKIFHFSWIVISSALVESK